MKIALRFLKTVLIILLPLVILLSILEHYSFNKDFYMEEYKKYDVQKVTKMDMEDLEKVTERIISYLKDEEDSLEIKAEIDGNYREVFGEREKLHMVDVKELFLKGYHIRNTSLILITLGLILIITVSSNKFKDIGQVLFSSSILSILSMVILFLLVKSDFNKYFTYFHKIFFTNDLWLLDPEKEVLIQMLPLEFFMDITIRVIGWFTGIIILLGIIGCYLMKKPINHQINN